MKLRITLHVFGYGEDSTDKEIEIYEIEGDFRAGPNPLCLRVEKDGCAQNNMFSMEAFDGETATYYPFATHVKLNLREDLPKFGDWKLVK